MKVGVVAGNQREFKHLLAEKTINAEKFHRKTNGGVIDGVEYFYVSSTQSLRGLRDYELMFYGNWLNRADIDEIREIYRYSQELK